MAKSRTRAIINFDLTNSPQIPGKGKPNQRVRVAKTGVKVNVIGFVADRGIKALKNRVFANMLWVWEIMLRIDGWGGKNAQKTVRQY